ncbi:MAG: glutathione S-transferase family protein [Pseudomonadota bacterium]
MYKVIGATRTRTYRVMWMLEELGERYEHVAISPLDEKVKEVSPTGKIPALQDGDALLTDSVAIMTYLADKHGKLTAPPGSIARARQDAMTLWLIDEFDAVLWTAAKHTFALPEELRMPEIKEKLMAEFARSAAQLSDRLEGPFLMGNEMTIADILGCHCVNWSIGAGFPKVDERLSSWAKMLRERPAFKAVQAKA